MDVVKEAKFKQVANVIMRRVNDGSYGTKQKLPSEYDLADEFQVSRLTIRKAIDVLIEAQILVKSRHKGTYVMDTPKVESGRFGLQGFTEASESYGKKSHTEVLSFSKVEQPTDEILTTLQMKDGLNKNIYELIRRRYWDDSPMTIEQIYIPEFLVAGLSAKDFTGSLFAIIEKHEQIAYSQQEVEAMLTSKRVGELLKVPVDGPLLKVRSVTYTVDSKPIFLDISYYRADKYRFKTTLIRNKL